MKKLLVICGATASGKTALAVECAKRVNGEIISCDALLVYRGLNVGTAKPTASVFPSAISSALRCRFWKIFSPAERRPSFAEERVFI